MEVRKFILTIIFVIISLTSFGQILNARGLKVVEKIEVERYSYSDFDKDKLYSITNFIMSLGYNNSNELISFNYFTQHIRLADGELGDSYEKRFTLSNDRLTRKDYENGKLMKDYTFNYVLDGNVITKREVFNHDSDGGNGCLRFDKEYLYELSDDGYPRLIRTIDMWYTRLRGTNYFQKGDYEDSSSHERFTRIDGNVYSAFTTTHNGTLDHPIRYQDYDYSDKPNDTNVNWFGFYLGGSTQQTDLEMLTEWVNVRSDHLLNRYERDEYKYGYENGNITTINVYRNGKLQAKFTITYKMN